MMNVYNLKPTKQELEEVITREKEEYYSGNGGPHNLEVVEVMQAKLDIGDYAENLEKHLNKQADATTTD